MPKAPKNTPPDQHASEPDLPVTPDHVRAAAAAISSSVIVTECDQSRTLSEICGCNLWLKFENLQFTSTFKERGALNQLLALSPDERRRGVIAMSAGNHAQGVAYHAHRLGIPATIVMPVGTPMVKIENTRRHGAEIVISGKTLEEAAEFARAHGTAQNLTMVHPYDDPHVIAGQGTIALEMLGCRAAARYAGGSDRRRRADFRHGGRGQVAEAGIADHRRAGAALSFDVQRHQGRASADARRHAGRRHRRQGAGPDHHRHHPSSRRRIMLVTEDQIERAVAMLIAIEKTVVEGAGAAGLAAVLAAPERFPGAMSASCSPAATSIRG